MQTQTTSRPTAPSVRLLDEFSISIAKLKVVSAVLRSSDFTDGIDQDILTGLEFLFEGILQEQERIFRTLEGGQML